MMTNRLTKKMLIEMMRDEYHHRLVEVIGESDMFDSRGNMVIRKGLKVRHKDTQYEYTVDDVAKDEKGDVIVHLKAPEEPRFKTNDVSGDEHVLTGGKDDKEVLHEIDPPAVEPTTDEDEHLNDEVFVIDQEEFEKEYEVK